MAIVSWSRYVDDQEFVWSPIDDEDHFARTGRTLDARRKAVLQCRDEMKQARLQAEEAARAAMKRQKQRDEEREAVERLIRGCFVYPM